MKCIFFKGWGSSHLFSKLWWVLSDWIVKLLITSNVYYVKKRTFPKLVLNIIQISSERIENLLRNMRNCCRNPFFSRQANFHENTISRHIQGNFLMSSSSFAMHFSRYWDNLEKIQMKEEVQETFVTFQVSCFKTIPIIEENDYHRSEQDKTI